MNSMIGDRKRVSLVISARERYGEAESSLANVLATTTVPSDLIYVSGRAPRRLIQHIDSQAAKHGFKHIKVGRHLTPNEARNIGARSAAGEYIVFLDNDVFCAERWLEPLVETADSSRADVVTPLTCHGTPLHTVVHQAGGEFAPNPEAFFAQPVGEREIVERMPFQNDKASAHRFSTGPTQLCEFHGVLVRRSVFERLGFLDEGMMATKEHLDLCMTVLRAGGLVMFEPRSVVTYLFPNRKSPLHLADWPFFLLRWSVEWQLHSYQRFQEKWGLRNEGYLEDRVQMLKWRQVEGVVKPTLRRVPIIGGDARFQRYGHRLLGPLVSRASSALVALEARRRGRSSA